MKAIGKFFIYYSAALFIAGVWAGGVMFYNPPAKNELTPSAFAAKCAVFPDAYKASGTFYK